MGESLTWRPEEPQAPNLPLKPNLNQALRAKELETSHRTFRGKGTREVVVGIEEQDNTRLEVGEYLLLEEGEDPYIKTLDGIGNTGNGMKYKHLDQEPKETNRDGRKIQGVIIRIIEII